MRACQCCAQLACVVTCVAILVCVFFFLKRARVRAPLSNIEVRTLCRYVVRSFVVASLVCGVRNELTIDFALFVSLEGSVYCLEITFHAMLCVICSLPLIIF